VLWWALQVQNPSPKRTLSRSRATKQGARAATCFYYLVFFVRIPRCTRSCDHTAAVRNSRARPARATGVAGRGGRDGAVAPGKAEARRRGPRFPRPRNVGACHAKLYNPEPRGRAVRWRCGLPKFPKPRHLLNSRAHITLSLALCHSRVATRVQNFGEISAKFRYFFCFR